MAGLPVQTWQAEYDRIEPWLTDGRITKTQAFGDILRTCGQQPDARLVAAMVARDRELLLANGRLYDDAIGFLEALRARGIRIAIVSNCGETTRPLLVKLGVDVLADVLVLSCEAGSAKPDARIFTRARPARLPAGGRCVRGRPGSLLRGRRGRGHRRGADRAGRARREGARRGHHGGAVAARGTGDVRGVAGRRN